MAIATAVRPYTRQDVESLERGIVGVYAIYRPNGTCVYVGTGDIRTKLLANLDNDPPCINESQAATWHYAATDDPDPQEAQLIAELKPSCNE